ncbi:ricin-type beta-trefoil lectin domain protein [Streptomyces sp. NBC_01278]|uniref:ricin-type beta-trefoil lectin domain protein n=1 Tax=unclassified Streptomyces TaxID=2593676 RepID=UPI002E32EE32|nr:ricin-type beta-trefoil lectin domain protein [Streptomyces sp. NBC_01278]
MEQLPGSYVWSAGSGAPEILSVGATYKNPPLGSRQSALAPAKELSEPPVPTPEYVKKATDTSGAFYKSDGSARPATLGAATPPDFKACNSNNAGHNASGSGFVKNHFEFCRWGYNTLTKLDGQGRVEGQVYFKETEIGEGSNSRRVGVIHVKVTELKVSGVFLDASMTLSPSAAGHPGSCTTVFGSSSTVTEPLKYWDGRYLAYDVNGSEASGDQTRIDKPLTCNFRSNWKVEGPKGSSGWQNGPDQSLRMDSASYLKTIGVEATGAIFNRVTPWFLYDYNDANSRQVAEHIFNAYENPDSTDPWMDKKKIPGKVGSNTKLRRNFPEFNDAARLVAKNNEGSKDAACKRLVKGNSTYQCDEFPFASTQEGAGYGPFSVRYVPASANRSAGGKLGSWYAQDRILHDDEFQVGIDNRGKLVPASLISLHSGQALDAPNATPGAQVQMWDYWGGANQRFSFNDDNELRVFGNGCLDGGAGTPGTRVTVQPCSGANSQKWVGGMSIPTSIPSIFHATSGLCLDVSNRGTTNGTPVILWECTASINQKWRTS